jgi:hypothetical protein
MVVKNVKSRGYSHAIVSAGKVSLVGSVLAVKVPQMESY